MSSTHHASAVVIGDKGVLITGPSGTGKSTLARHLIDYARLNGRFGALIGDDRVHLEVVNGRILASPHVKIAGMIEIRGVGLATTNFIRSAAIDLLVSCQTVIKTRLPDEGERRDTVMSVPLPRIETRPDDPGSVFMALGFGHLTVRL
jgi:serine kinase of HPr protein (carbohydrate metabolism regulator)